MNSDVCINQTHQTQEGIAVRQGKPRNKKCDTKFAFFSHFTLKQILRFRISQLAWLLMSDWIW